MEAGGVPVLPEAGRVSAFPGLPAPVEPLDVWRFAGAGCFAVATCFAFAGCAATFARFGARFGADAFLTVAFVPGLWTAFAARGAGAGAAAGPAVSLRVASLAPVN